MNHNELCLSFEKDEMKLLEMQLTSSKCIRNYIGSFPSCTEILHVFSNLHQNSTLFKRESHRQKRDWKPNTLLQTCEIFRAAFQPTMMFQLKSGHYRTVPAAESWFPSVLCT